MVNMTVVALGLRGQDVGLGFRVKGVGLRVEFGALAEFGAYGACFAKEKSHHHNLACQYSPCKRKLKLRHYAGMNLIS